MGSRNRNKKTSKQLEELFGQEAVPVREEHLNQTIKLAGLEYRTCRKPGAAPGQYILLELYYTGRYMGIWQGLQALAFLVVLEILFKGHFLRFLDTRHIPFILCCAALTAVWSLVPVLYRSARYKMAEVEAAARFSGGKRIVIQLILMVCIETVILALLYVGMRMKFGTHPGTAALYLFIPYMAGIAVLMYCLRHITAGNSIRCFGVLWIITLSVLVLLQRFLPAFYQGDFNIVWALAGVLSAAAMAVQGTGIWRGGYVLKWVEE